MEMRKKTLFVILMAVLFISFLPAADFIHLMLGYVGEKADFSVEMDDSVLPFDLMSAEVRRTGNGAKGKRIGSYTLIANNNGFGFYVAHTPLSTLSTPEQGQTTSIDYMLYFILEGEKYVSCLSVPEEQVSNPKTASNHIEVTPVKLVEKGINVSGLVVFVGQSMYVNLESSEGVAAEATVNSLASGLYSSTIRFYLEGN